MPFHAGELAVQRRAGVSEAAERLGQSVRGELTTKSIGRAQAAHVAALATCDEEGQPWAWLLAGEPGFLEAGSERELLVRPAHPLEPALKRHLAAHARVGLVGIDLTTGLRVRVNGRAEVDGEGLRILVEEAFTNCPKYVRKRPPLTRAPAPAPDGRALIDRADTFFLATRSADGRLDASHRGGEPGFVTVVDEATLRWSDYPGNNMFQTLGNLAQDDRAGLLFVDFERAATLQIAATGEVTWDGDGRVVTARTARRTAPSTSR
jgi:predicted pyridoxine 5'-phosphate oxidase superfamily flavin-nucleotide-binding protein